MRFRDVQGWRPVARVELYESVRHKNVRKARTLADIRRGTQRAPRRGVALRIEVDIPVAKATRPWHIQLRTGAVGCWQCMRAALHDAVTEVEAVAGVEAWRAGNGLRTAAYVHLFDGPGSPKQARHAVEARRRAVAMLMSLGYLVYELDSRGVVREHPPLVRWRQHQDCKLIHGPRLQSRPSVH